jgi:arylformamidase
MQSEKKIQPDPENFIDISVPLTDGMVNWPGDPPVAISRMRNQASGDTATVSRLDMGAHTGTHMDAPLHFISGAAGIDTMPITAGIGPCRVIELDDETSISRASIEAHEVLAGERILLKTRNSNQSWWNDPFDENFVYISADAAGYLAHQNVMTIGVDYLSVGGFHHDGVATHLALLEANIWIIEGLDLTRVRAGRYMLYCLPLKMQDGDGAPARAVLAPYRSAEEGCP